MSRAERIARTKRVVARRQRLAKSVTKVRRKPGELRKTPPVCYCTICRLSRRAVRVSTAPSYD